MEKKHIFQIIIIVILAIILGILVNWTLTTIKNNNSMQMPNDQMVQPNGQMPGQGGMEADISYSATDEITKDTTIEDEKFTSDKADENVLLVSGDIEVNATNIEVTKTGDSDGGDNTSFYGTNSAILAKSGATLNLKNITVTTNATGANGVFSYGGSATTNNVKSDGTVVNISDSQITIKDYGVGIDKKDLPHIFERFYKGKNASIDSVGIGLALSKAIIEKSNGDISVESKENKGTMFIIKYYN